MRCPYCGWPDAEPFEVVSRHRTPEGLTVWTRCCCGSLQVRVTDGVSTRIVSRSRQGTTGQAWTGSFSSDSSR
jgi:hypothetical protein